MKTPAAILESIRPRVHVYAAYTANLYFIEILSLFMVSLYVAGKTISMIMGGTLAALLAVHIVMLYNRRDLHRKIHLFLIDLHAAYTVAYLVQSALFGFGDTNGALALTVIPFAVRCLLLVCELPLVWLLTDERVRALFSRA